MPLCVFKKKIVNVGIFLSIYTDHRLMKLTLKQIIWKGMATHEIPNMTHIHRHEAYPPTATNYMIT